MSSSSSEGLRVAPVALEAERAHALELGRGEQPLVAGQPGAVDLLGLDAPDLDLGVRERPGLRAWHHAPEDRTAAPLVVRRPKYLKVAIVDTLQGRVS